MLRAKVSGIGAYVPPKVVTNDDLTKFMETSDEWIQQRTGIQERRWVEDIGECTSDLALKASEAALKDAGITAKDLDMIIFATLSPDHDFPGTGCFLQAKLDCPGIPAIDIRQQCSGFIYGTSIADNFIRSGQYKNILLVGSEVHSRALDKTTRGRDVSVLFGDAAGAFVFTATDVKDESEPQVLSHHLFSDGRFAKELWIPAPGSALGIPGRINEEIMKEGLHYPYMNGRKVFQHAVKGMIESIQVCLQHNSISIDDIDLFAFHQANMRINDTIAEKLQIAPEKVFNTIQKYGNTTAATIPLGLHDAREAGVLKPGMLVMCSAFGAGFTWASSLFRY